MSNVVGAKAHPCSRAVFTVDSKLVTGVAPGGATAAADAWRINPSCEGGARRLTPSAPRAARWGLTFGMETNVQDALLIYCINFVHIFRGCEKNLIFVNPLLVNYNSFIKTIKEHVCIKYVI
ncbi:Protein of unknown function [Gryllus bimaculatus]|nr:Protein of unknown function [Gryllus bimaculatus]